MATTQHARTEDVAHRRAPITGVSEFALLTESAVRRVPWPESPRLAAGALHPHRYAASFETLRDRSDAAAARGQRPGVYLAVLGQYPARGARTGFAADLFRAGGLEPSTGSVEAYRADGAAVTCLVGSDASYEAQGAAAVATLRAAGARQVWLAGTARVPGVDGTLHRGCDALGGAAVCARFCWGRQMIPDFSHATLTAQESDEPAEQFRPARRGRRPRAST